MEKRGEKLQKIGEFIGGLQQCLRHNQASVKKLKKLAPGTTPDMDTIKDQVEKLQDAPDLTLDNIEDTEKGSSGFFWCFLIGVFKSF